MLNPFDLGSHTARAPLPRGERGDNPPNSGGAPCLSPSRSIGLFRRCSRAYNPPRRSGASSLRGGMPVAEKDSELVVETFKLTKIYQNRQIALNDVTLRLEPGAVLGLLGSNGAGKTTLLRLLMGLHRPTAGWARVFGKNMNPNAADLRRRIGFIPTNPQFPRGMTPITY